MSTIIKGVIIAFILLTLIDSGFMIKYLITQASVISQASFARLVTFVLTHFYFAFMLGILYQTDHSSLEDIQIYRYSEWLVNAFVPIAVIDTLIEIMLFVLLGSQKMVSDRNVPPELKQRELHLINFYFMTYMYVMIIGIMSSIYLCVNKFLERLEKSKYQDVVKEILQKFLIELEPTQPKLRQTECSICQLQFVSGQQLAQRRKISVVSLQSGHLFHKECILEWVKKTYEESMHAKCPNCRRRIEP